MTDHIDAIERLHRLKESGAISEEEYSSEKSRLLAAAASPDAKAVAGTKSHSDQHSTRVFSKGVIGGAFVGLLVVSAAAWIGLSNSNGPTGAPIAYSSDAATAIATSTPVALASLPEEEQLRLASRAALGFVGTRTRKDGTQAVITKAERLLQMPFGAVLLTSTRRPDGCHACSGFVGVYYLRDVGGVFQVTGKWPQAVAGWGWGNVPDWRLSNAYTSNLAVVAGGTDGGQGYFCGGTTITELTPKGPITSFIATSATNGGAVDPDSGTDMGGNPLKELDGKIVNVQKGKSLQVRVTGTDSFSENYVMRGGKFQLASGETKLSC